MKDYPDVKTAKGAIITGDVTFGKGCTVWYNAVIRADSAPVYIGDNTNIQDNCVIHVDKDMPVKIGNNVTVGHSAILHCCEIGDNTTVGMGAIVLNGAKIGKNSLVAAGALVPQYREYPDGVLIMGTPAKAVRELTPQEIEHSLFGAKIYSEAEEVDGDLQLLYK